MRTMAYEFCRHTNNRETQSKIEAIAKEHPDFWIPYQSFENYILTVFLLESINNPTGIIPELTHE